MEYKDITYDFFYNGNNRFIALSAISNIVSGIYTHASDTFVLENYHTNGDISTGYSRRIGSFIEIEPDLIMPLFPRHTDISFISTESLKDEEKGIIVLDVKKNTRSENQTLAEIIKQHPSFERYIKLCDLPTQVSSNTPSNFNILNSKQASIFTQSKHILTFPEDQCLSFFDKYGRYAITTGMYAVKPNNPNILISDKVLTAIFNSKLFSYLRSVFEDSINGMRTKRYDSIAQFPIPSFSASVTICRAIERVADCLYLSKRLSIYDSKSDYLREIMDVLIYQLYFEPYMFERGLSILHDIECSPLLKNQVQSEELISLVYQWYMSPGNVVRQTIMLLDSRSPELLYPIHNKFIR